MVMRLRFITCSVEVDKLIELIEAIKQELRSRVGPGSAGIESRFRK